jgi:diguanylate cyclase (GGDEF)-like protein
MDTAWRTLPLLGMRGCWIALFDETGGDKQRVRLRLAYDQDGRTDLSDQGRIFPVDMLLPDEILGANRTFDLIVNSLYFGDTFFGYIIFEIDQPDQKIIEMITSQVGTALQGAKVVNEIQNMQIEFRRQANTDPLTEIYNRRALYTLAEPCFQLARRHNLPFSVAMIDLDNFKRVNDVYGHSVGDQLLHDLSAFIKAQIRGSDIFGRFGGEEFLLILPQTPLDRAIFLIERIRKSIDEHCFDIGLQKIPLTISAGVAALDPEQDHLIDQLINNADRALYRAKGSGKNCVVANQADE